MAAGFSLTAAPARRLPQFRARTNSAAQARRWPRPAIFIWMRCPRPPAPMSALVRGDRPGRALWRGQSRTAAGAFPMCEWPSPMWWAVPMCKLRLVRRRRRAAGRHRLPRPWARRWARGCSQSRGRPIHAAGRLSRDDWNGRVRVQLEIEDAAPASALIRQVKTVACKSRTWAVKSPASGSALRLSVRT